MKLPAIGRRQQQTDRLKALDQTVARHRRIQNAYNRKNERCDTTFSDTAIILKSDRSFVYNRKIHINSQCNTFTSIQGDRLSYLRFNYSQVYFNSQVLVTGLTQNLSCISAPHIGRFFLQMILDIFCIHVSLLSGNMVTTVEYRTRQANLEMAC